MPKFCIHRVTCITISRYTHRCLCIRMNTRQNKYKQSRFIFISSSFYQGLKPSSSSSFKSYCTKFYVLKNHQYPSLIWCTSTINHNNSSYLIRNWCTCQEGIFHVKISILGNEISYMNKDKRFLNSILEIIFTIDWSMFKTSYSISFRMEN